MTTTKDRILDTAERLFAERGFDGTSLRAITSQAGVNLAAVNYHFSTKEALLHSLFVRRLALLNQRRIAQLDAYEAETRGGPVPLEKVVRAFLEPVLRLGGDPAAGGTGFGMLMGRMYSWPSAHVQRVLASEIRELIDRFRSAFRRALPQVPERELYWRVFFSIGAMAHALAGSSLLEIISGGICDPSDVDGTVDRLIAFVTAGLRAPLPEGRRARKADGARPAAARAVRPPRRLQAASPGSPRR